MPKPRRNYRTASSACFLRGACSSQFLASSFVLGFVEVQANRVQVPPTMEHNNAARAHCLLSLSLPSIAKYTGRVGRQRGEPENAPPHRAAQREKSRGVTASLGMRLRSLSPSRATLTYLKKPVVKKSIHSSPYCQIRSNFHPLNEWNHLNFIPDVRQKHAPQLKKRLQLFSNEWTFLRY